MITKEKNKGNIPIDKKLLNRYSTARAIFNDAENIFKHNCRKIKLFDIEDIKNINLDNLKICDIKRFANNIFNKYHDKKYFFNNDNKIIVSKSRINESIQKIYNNKYQRNLMKENLIVFANLGKIIETSVLVNQITERKNRKGIKYWNYYINKVYINNEEYLISFDIRTLDSNQNQYRIQRIELRKKQVV